jgi:transcriptional regulator with XRE-family HTH domain
MTPEKEKNGEKLKRLRKCKKLSQKQLAAKCGCSNAMISGIETGDKKPSTKLAKSIALFFNDEITRLELLYSE